MNSWSLEKTKDWPRHLPNIARGCTKKVDKSVDNLSV
jgi:hypothetical protein